MNDVKRVAFAYGRAVAVRERYGNHSSYFYDLNERCLSLYRQLIELGAYADDENSKLKNEYRESYLDGLGC